MQEQKLNNEQNADVTTSNQPIAKPDVGRSLFVGENFSNVHHKIIDGLGTVLSGLGADSGIMSIVMSWGDTQDSMSTLEMLNDYIERYINTQPQHQ